jgi:molybdate transport system permease protein
MNSLLLGSLADFPPEIYEALWLTFKLAITVTILLLLVSIPLAWWLSACRSRAMVLVETIITLPIVLPPTVLGFYLLVLFSPQQPLGKLWYQIQGSTLAFSFPGLVFGSVLYSLPYAVQPVLAAFRSVPGTYTDASRGLGASAFKTFWRIILPLSRRGIYVAAILGFAHTVGEFGVILMIGGSIPGQTRVASIALYDEVQKINYPVAHKLAIVLLGAAFLTVLTINLLQRRVDHRT